MAVLESLLIALMIAVFILAILMIVGMIVAMVLLMRVAWKQYKNAVGPDGKYRWKTSGSGSR